MVFGSINFSYLPFLKFTYISICDSTQSCSFPFSHLVCLPFSSAVISALKNTKSPDLFCIAFRLSSCLLIQVLFYTQINLSETAFPLKNSFLSLAQVHFILTNLVFLNVLSFTPSVNRLPHEIDNYSFPEQSILFHFCSYPPDFLFSYPSFPFTYVAHEDPILLPFPFSKLLWTILSHSHLSSLTNSFDTHIVCLLHKESNEGKQYISTQKFLALCSLCSGH